MCVQFLGPIWCSRAKPRGPISQPRQQICACESICSLYALLIACLKSAWDAHRFLLERVCFILKFDLRALKYWIQTTRNASFHSFFNTQILHSFDVSRCCRIPPAVTDPLSPTPILFFSSRGPTERFLEAYNSQSPTITASDLVLLRRLSAHSSEPHPHVAPKGGLIITRNAAGGNLPSARSSLGDSKEAILVLETKSLFCSDVRPLFQGSDWMKTRNVTLIK